MTTDPLNVSPHERGAVRVFRTDRPARALKDDLGGVSELEAALGGVPLRAAYVEVFDLKDLGDMSLAEFLREAHAVELPENHDLDAATGTIIVIASGATPEGATFRPDPSLTFLGRFAEPADTRPLEPLSSPSAEGGLGTGPGPKRSDARVSGMVALAALVVMGLVVILMIWIGG